MSILRARKWKERISVSRVSDNASSYLKGRWGGEKGRQMSDEFCFQIPNCAGACEKAHKLKNETQGRKY